MVFSTGWGEKKTVHFASQYVRDPTLTLRQDPGRRPGISTAGASILK
jgi:hypothetical protein